jgi:hypothetical protein
MNNRVLVISTVVAATSLGVALTVGVERTHAQNLPLDECTNVGNSAPTTQLCLHHFSDHSKCVVAITRGPQFATSNLSCKIT